MAVAVLAVCAGLDNVFHSPTSVSRLERNSDFLCSRLINEWRCLHNKGHNPFSWSLARQLSCFVFDFIVKMLMTVLYVRFLKGNILFAPFT